MSDGNETVVNKRRLAGKDSTGIYESSTDALKQINEAFDYWSGQITVTSLQMCYALIGANWVIFGSVGNILHSRYAIVSLLLVVLALTFNMVSAYVLPEYMRSRFGYAVSDRKRWEAEFQHEKIESTTWPYSKWTEEASIATRLIKVILPLASGVCLVIGAVITSR
jgi:cytochrome bd-type quinol oxidase subunit 2